MIIETIIGGAVIAVVAREIGELMAREIGEVMAREIGEVMAREIGEVMAREIGEVMAEVGVAETAVVVGEMEVDMEEMITGLYIFYYF